MRHPSIRRTRDGSPDAETTPEITSDGLTIFVASARTGTAGAADIWVSTRASRSSVWGTPIRVAALSSPTENAASAPTDDLLTIVQIGNPTSTNAEMYASSRATPNGTWSTPTAITSANSTANDFSPMLTPDKLTMYFDSNRGNTNHDLFVATRTAPTGTFDTPQKILELATSASETDPWISPDGRTLVFMRDGTLYQATR